MEYLGKILISIYAIGIAIILVIIGVYIYGSWQDSKSPEKPMTCTIKEKYVVSNKGRESDRVIRTQQCGKLSVGRRYEVWDSLKEGHTYILSVKGGHTGLKDVMSAKKATATEATRS